LAGTWGWLLAAVLVQFVLGVFTVITQVQIALGVVHQLGALLLLAALVHVLHRTGRVATRSPEVP
jgi:cytochrome c oxidase assembly protein subunit 15